MKIQNPELSVSVKKSTRNVLLCSLVTIGFAAFSQRSAYYIKPKGDTVWGSIKRVNIGLMQERVHFIDENNKKITVQPGEDAKEVGFDVDGQFYKMRAFKLGDFDKTAIFKKEDYKFLSVYFEGKIEGYIYYSNDSYGKTQSDIYVYKVETKDWGLVAMVGHKKIAKKFFADCSPAMRNFESNDGYKEFLNCVQFYNSNCE